MQTSPIRIRRASPATPEAARVLRAYGAELVGRGRPFSPVEPPVGRRPASWVEPYELEPPSGAFLLAEDRGVAVGCGGVRTLAPGLGEVKRMYVVPGARRRGIARRILGELEQAARELGHTRVRLDTNAVQPEAVALYHACGYTEIADYNGNPFATHWYEKQLT
ncbi:GNAT family N-acetyltransferase [Conexibacter sp. CPCC 206217]|uniref:GNAT family N-acetyltransferase n=1 Tax=Conexibacter sp. CPCC 206217 TaxID=3064574 RepID=UPI0027259D19|nr:GNAT family N-acetyltransferase [Conexibacter sp. CPCC 206217]MDO8212791.1 GNAT family N-acetyltransferase [Conexibacter sp. CPCC 206217]